MTAVPRIERARPTGPITKPEAPVPVVARLRWAHGEDIDTDAVAIAWTRTEVQIRWQPPGDWDLRDDWIIAVDIRRHWDDPPRGEDRPPDSRGMRKNDRW